MGNSLSQLPPHLQDAVRTQLLRQRPEPAKAAPPKDRGMNRNEAAYAAHLDMLKLGGEIIDHYYQPIKVRLADNTYYTPDFLVVAKDGVCELHDCKGYKKKVGDDFWCEEDAKIKIKVVAELVPFRVCITWKSGGVWKRKDF